jgi:hypothetical protein
MASLLHYFAPRFASLAAAACFTCSPGASVCRSARSNLSEICLIISTPSISKWFRQGVFLVLGDRPNAPTMDKS